MSERKETAVVPYVFTLITQGFEYANRIEGNNMRIGRALGHEYAERIDGDMQNLGDIENEVVRLEALICLLRCVSVQTKANTDELLGCNNAS